MLHDSLRSLRRNATGARCYSSRTFPECPAELKCCQCGGQACLSPTPFSGSDRLRKLAGIGSFPTATTLGGLQRERSPLSQVILPRGSDRSRVEQRVGDPLEECILEGSVHNINFCEELVQTEGRRESRNWVIKERKNARKKKGMNE